MKTNCWFHQTFSVWNVPLSIVYGEQGEFQDASGLGISWF